MSDTGQHARGAGPGGGPGRHTGAMKLVVGMAAAAVLLAGCGSDAGEAGHSGTAPASDVIVQLFEWNWKSVGAECPTLAKEGYGAVQISPAQEHVEVAGHPWWQDYQPVSYKLTSRRGDDGALKSMIAACHKAGVKVYADAVMNHMAGIDSGIGSAGTKFTHYDYPGTWGPGDFHHCKTADGDIHDYQNRSEVQNCELSNLADLKTESPSVRTKLTEYLNTLVSLGIDGFRIDAAKHIPATDLKAILAGVRGKPFIFQEVIDHGNEPITSSEYVPNGKVIVFTYGEQVGKEFQWGSISALKGISGPVPSADAVVMLSNHDTERNGGSTIVTYANREEDELATAFMLAWSYGEPKVMSSYDFGENSDLGPPSGADGTTSDTACGKVWVCQHRWPTTVAMIGFHRTVAGTPSDHWWDNGGNAIAFGRGTKGFIAINNENKPLTHTFATGLAAGKYCNILSGSGSAEGCSSPVSVASDGTFTATLKPHTALAIDVDHKG